MKVHHCIDVCCGGRMFYFDKHNPDVVFMDNRKFTVKPDVVADFRNIPFKDDTFNLVVFDPPHLIKVGDKSWLAKSTVNLTHIHIKMIYLKGLGNVSEF